MNKDPASSTSASNNSLIEPTSITNNYSIGMIVGIVAAVCVLLASLVVAYYKYKKLVFFLFKQVLVIWAFNTIWVCFLIRLTNL